MHRRHAEKKHRACRDSQPEDLRVRIQRAISWLERAEQEPDDADERFVFLWIALNAAYAQEFGFERSEREQAAAFIRQLLDSGRGSRLDKVLFDSFSGPIRLLIENRFVFDPCWKVLRDHDSSDHWKQQFAKARERAMRALIARETDVVMSIVADRLYVLRNQVVHGGATWNSSINRAQVHAAAAILGALMPVIIDLMMDCDALSAHRITYPKLPSPA